MRTHVVTNVVPAPSGLNVLRSDAALTEAVDRWVAPGRPGRGGLARRRWARSPAPREVRRWADQADRVTPVLRTHAAHRRAGRRGRVPPGLPPAHGVAVGNGLTAEPWTRPAGSGAHARRAAGFVVWSQVEAGHLCPVSMTYAAAPALAAEPDLAARWMPGLASRAYDPVLAPHADKAGLTVGMGMTEKQGGSDVRANTTRAVAAPGGPLEGETYRLTGHKWFCSAPMSDAFLVLAQTDAGIGCFLLPRVLDDGTRNEIRLQRLKDKLGNRSNASSEIELDGAWAVRVGDEGRGIRTIIDMVASTRLDCVLGSTATMRAALVRAVHHARHRSAFGALLVDQPLMRNVLADLALESEAATVLGDAAGPRRRRGRGRLLAARRGPGQVLGVQAHRADGRRGAGVPGRQRLRRGERPGPALPRGPAQLDLGGLGQRQRARRRARADPRAGLPGGPGQGARAGPRPRPGARRRHRRLRVGRGAGARPGRPVGRPPARRAPRR